MAYNANIPQPGDLLSQSQGQILANFQALSGAAINTFPYVLLPIQGSDPAVSTTQMALYTKTSSITSQPEMFIERNSGSTTAPNPIEFTSYYANSTTLKGFTRLPSGLLIAFGLKNPTGIGSQTYSWASLMAGATGWPGWTTLYNVQITTSAIGNVATDSFIQLLQFNTTNLIISATKRTTTSPQTGQFYFFAIGT